MQDYETEILKFLDQASYCKRKLLLAVDKAMPKFPGIQNIKEFKKRLEEFLGLSISTLNVNDKNEILETYMKENVDDVLLKEEVGNKYDLVKEEKTDGQDYIETNFQK